jgi:hypothetical protein
LRLLLDIPEVGRVTIVRCNGRIVLVGPYLTSFAAHHGFQTACASLPVIELGDDFPTRCAGEAGAGLLEMIEARLNPKSA